MWLEWRKWSSPEIGSGKDIFPGEQAFVIKYVMGILHNDYFHPSTPARARRGSFLDHCENMMEFLEVKPMKTCSLKEFPRCSLVHIWLPPICQNSQLRVPTSLWLQQLLLHVIRSCLCLSGFAYLSGLRGAGLPCNFMSLKDARIVVDTQFFKLFSF